jgi:hypothetical protein
MIARRLIGRILGFDPGDRGSTPRARTSDAELEAAIDRVGRDRVFACARLNGWSSACAPPRWVWWGIVHEIEAEDGQADLAASECHVSTEGGLNG